MQQRNILHVEDVLYLYSSSVTVLRCCNPNTMQYQDSGLGVLPGLPQRCALAVNRFQPGLNPSKLARHGVTKYQADVPSDRARAWEFIDGSWAYDVERYTELLMRAVETVFTPFGVNASMLRSWLVKELPPENLRARLEAKPRAYLGPLFDLAIPVVTASHSLSQTR